MIAFALPVHRRRRDGSAPGAQGADEVVTLFNQLLVIPTLYYPLFFAITGAVRGLSVDASIERARNNFAPLMERNLKFWLPVQFAQFFYIAEEWQVTYVCVAGLVWNVILSLIANK